jgi:hypothetical protein
MHVRNPIGMETHDNIPYRSTHPTLRPWCGTILPLLLAFVGSTMAEAELSRAPEVVAREILDNTKSNAAREAVIKAYPALAADLIVEITKDLNPGELEYERIPWIWRVSVAAGRRNDADEIRRILKASLPRDGEPLRDWQAVVIGGGVINGISEQGVRPKPRIEEVIGNDAALVARWQRALDLSSAMADEERVPKGTRYDALRMLGVAAWEKRGDQVVRYLAKEVNAELQMGAVSGLVDMDAPEATQALINALPGLTDRNRDLALDGLLRDDARTAALLNALEENRVDPSVVGQARLKRLRERKTEIPSKQSGTP